MSRLYDLTQDFEALYDQLDTLDPEAEEYEDLMTAFFDTIEGIEGEFNQEAEALAVFYKRLAAQACDMKAEEAKLRARRNTLESKAARIKAFLCLAMEKDVYKRQI